MTAAPGRITAQRGSELRCKGWRQEAILRLLENNLENAENPDALVVYMSVAKAARDWASFGRIVQALQRLQSNETLVMQSGKPVGVFRTGGHGPLVVMANGNLVPDVVTDQTSTEPVGGYYPVSIPPEETRRLWSAEPDSVRPLAYEAMRIHVEAMAEFQRRGAVVFEYGNNLRNRATVGAGAKRAFEMPSFVDLFIRPYFCEGIGPFRWIAVSGEPQDIHTIDALILREFAGNEQICSWIAKAREHIKFQGLPARIGWLGHRERSRLALLVNDLVARGALAGPVAFTRDHLDGASAAMPYRETENMQDGSDAISDWPILNALLNGAAGADLVAVHQLGDYGQSAGVTIVADGTPEAAARLERVLDCDTGLGVLRLADAGYQAALQAKERHGLGL